MGEIQKASIHLNLKTEENDFDEFEDAIGEQIEDVKESSIYAKEPVERDKLPWLKDPSIKVGIWAIIKDNLGKDMTKISVPVFFNDPTNLLQKAAQSMEYTSILD